MTYNFGIMLRKTDTCNERWWQGVGGGEEEPTAKVLNATDASWNCWLAYGNAFNSINQHVTTDIQIFTYINTSTTWSTTVFIATSCMLIRCSVRIWCAVYSLVFRGPHASTELCLGWHGRISGIVARAINFTPSTQLWVLLNTIKLAVAVRRRLSTDFD